MRWGVAADPDAPGAGPDRPAAVGLRALGFEALGITLRWDRIVPEGRGAPDPGAVDGLGRLVDLALEERLEPVVTIHDGALPGAVALRGGWTHPDTADRFADFAHAALRLVGDRVPTWLTIAEPGRIVARAFDGDGIPGRPRGATAAESAAVHVLQAHGLAVQACRAEGGRSIGPAARPEPRVPATDRRSDVAAAERAAVAAWRQFLDPVLLGSWPEEAEEIYGEGFRLRAAETLRLASEPTDVTGAAYASRRVVRAEGAAGPARALEIGSDPAPEGLRDALRDLVDRYGARRWVVTLDAEALSRDHADALDEGCSAGADVVVALIPMDAARALPSLIAR
jgi:beta-glucosidase